MKILKTDSFVSERIKVQPVTNAELDKIKDEYGRYTPIENMTYDDICQEGNVVFVYDGTDIKPYLVKQYDGAMCLNGVGKDEDPIYRKFWYSKEFKNKFPYYCHSKIIKVFKANIDTTLIENAADLEKALRPYYDILQNNESLNNTSKT